MNKGIESLLINSFKMQCIIVLALDRTSQVTFKVCFHCMVKLQLPAIAYSTAFLVDAGSKTYTASYELKEFFFFVFVF